MADFSLITSEAELATIIGDWRQLHARNSWSPFTSYDWFAAWWHNIGKPGGWFLHIVVAKKGGRIIGILPLAVERIKGLRILQWAGAEWFDYCDVLTENDATAALLWQKARKSGLYDIAVIRDVHKNARSFNALAAFARVRERKTASYLDINWSSGESWLHSLPKKKRGIMRRRTNQMEQKAPVAVSLTTTGPVDDTLLDIIMRQKTVWLAANGHKLIFDQPGGRDMFRILVNNAAQEGLLHLSRLTCGTEIVACHVCFLYKNTLYSYQSSYEPSWAHYSPGTVLFMNTICQAADRGIKRMDHMRGAYPYKNKYSSGAAELIDYGFSGSFIGSLAELIHTAKSRLIPQTSKAEANKCEADQDWAI